MANFTPVQAPVQLLTTKGRRRYYANPYCLTAPHTDDGARTDLQSSTPLCGEELDRSLQWSKVGHQLGDGYELRKWYAQT